MKKTPPTLIGNSLTSTSRQCETKRPTYLFSPLSKSTVTKSPQQTLLLEFLLNEIFFSHQAIVQGAPIDKILSADPRLFPYDWGHSNGHLNKLREHASLLASSFPEMATEVVAFQKEVEACILSLQGDPGYRQKLPDHLQRLYQLLIPFLEKCKKNENLMFYLLKHRKEIDALMGHSQLKNLLQSFFGAHYENLQARVADRFHKRGFLSVIPELKKLFSELNHV